MQPETDRTTTTTTSQADPNETELDRLIRERGLDEIVASLTEEEWAQALFDWHLNARPTQIAPPGDWRTWLIQAGRGWGKTRCGVEWIRHHAEAGEPYPMYLVGATAADVRDVMVEGESGILAKSPPWFRPEYEPSKRRLTWPNGVVAFLRSADEPNRLRGPQGSKCWADEVAAWRFPDAWDQINMMIRLGVPQIAATTTPRPTELIRSIINDPYTVVTRGATRDNLRNLAPSFVDYVYRKYEGTRLGRQELAGDLLTDTPGALWKMAMIETLRVERAPDLRRIVIGVDPAVKGLVAGADPDDQGAETGIVAVGVGPCSCKGTEEQHGFVLEDRSDHYSPNDWAQAIAGLYRDLQADRVVAEINNGGALVESNIRTLGDRNISYKAVHAAKGKETRAEPIAALYEQGRVHHVGSLAKLEDQQCTWQPLRSKRSPDRVDALVWALTELMMEAAPPTYHRPRGEGWRPRT